MSRTLNLNSLTVYDIDGNREKVRFDTEVVVSDEERYTTLEYIEPPADEESDAVLTRLTVHNDNSATLVRTAYSSGRQIMGITLRQGNCEEFLYSTDYGTFKMECSTDLVRHNISEKGGVIVLKYLLDFGDGSPIKYRMMLTVEEKGADDKPKCTGSCEGCTLCG